MPAFSPAKDLKGLEKSPTVRMELGRSKVKVVQNFNLKVRERKPNLKLMPQRLQHHNIRILTLRGRRANPLILTRNHKFMITGRVGCDVSLGSIGPIMKTLLLALLHFLKPGIVLDGTFLLDEISGSPQECPCIP